ncbi:MAG: hypothetical protein ACRDZ7_15860 [Acidimicrobiia bacterium]
MTTTDPTPDTTKEKPAMNQIAFVMPGKVFNVLTGDLLLKDVTVKLTKAQETILDKAERVERSKGFAARFALTTKQADTLITLLSETMDSIRQVKGRSHHENNSLTYMAKTIDRIAAAQDDAAADS